MTPVEIMARADFQARWRTDKDWESIPEDRREFYRKMFRKSVAALEAAGWRIVGEEYTGLIADNARLRALLAEAIKQLAISLCRAAGHDPFNPTDDVFCPDDPECIFPWAGYRKEAERLLSEPTPPVPRPLSGNG